MHSASRPPAALFDTRRVRRFVLMGAATLAVLLASGCQSVPPVSTPPPRNAQTITAGTDLDWTSKSRSCQEARREVKKAAKRECKLASYSVASDSCECDNEERGARFWHCSTQAVFTCEGGEPIGLAAKE